MNIRLQILLVAVCGWLAGQPVESIAAETGEVLPRILIRNVSVWDGTSDAADPGRDVLIEGRLIKAIGNQQSPGDNVMVIDGGGRVLIPGIIDAHTHLALPAAPTEIHRLDPGYVTALSVKAARGVLSRGWTTVRDIGGPSQGLARAIDEGHLDGPRIYSSAMFISQTSGHGDFRALTDPHPSVGSGANAFAQRYTLIADGPAEVKRAVRESLRQGATAIKVMAGGGVSSEYDPIDTTQYSVAELRAAVEAAADWNTYVAVHAYTDAAVLRALDAGVKVIEHGHLISESTLKRLKADGAYLSSQSFGFIRTYLANQPSSRARKGMQVVEGVDNLMTNARKLGIPVAFGTDAFGSFRAYEAAPREFGYRLRWFNSLEILKQATSHNAKLLALTGPRNPYQDGPLGVIEPGAYADLLIVDGDPLGDIRVLEDHANNIRMIMKDGQIYKNTLD
ncbi:MAG: amidohydrolase family protein [Gammaproteobacteria bacterium]|nr:amidohydrolase family protein [Gammaproteobacteria bacterium]